MLARAWSALALLMMALLERARGVAARQPFGGAGMSGKGTWFSLVSYATAVCWIFSNERSAVQCTGLWDRAKRAVLSVGKPADVPAGALAHTVGTAVSEKKIADSTTGVETPSPAIMMRRVVEQYQWKEESRGRKHKVQIHTYDKIWSRSLLDSSKYVDMEAHVNPPTMLLRGMTKAPDGVLVNGFALQHSLLIQLAPAAYERFAVAPDEIKLPPSLGIRVLGKAPDGRIYMRKTEQVKRQEIVVGEEAAAAEDAKKNKGFLGRSVYISGNTLAAPEGDDERLSHFEPWNRPLIGDMRIYWECAAPQQVAVMAKHAGGGALEPWGGLGAGPKTNAPATSQEAVFTLNMGESSASGLVSDATSAIGSEIWEARAFGFGSTTMGECSTVHAAIMECSPT